MERKNVPLTREQVKALPALKDENGKPRPSYIPPYPNNRERRLDTTRCKGNNRKLGKSRRNQRVEITYKAPQYDEKGAPVLDKDGQPVYATQRTGYFKTIRHQKVPAKIERAFRKIMERLESNARDRIALIGAEEAGELSEHAKINS